MLDVYILPRSAWPNSWATWAQTRPLSGRTVSSMSPRASSFLARGSPKLLIAVLREEDMILKGWIDNMNMHEATRSQNSEYFARAHETVKAFETVFTEWLVHCKLLAQPNVQYYQYRMLHKIGHISRLKIGWTPCMIAAYSTCFSVGWRDHPKTKSDLITMWNASELGCKVLYCTCSCNLSGVIFLIQRIFFLK